jgi:hypothetical protein
LCVAELAVEDARVFRRTGPLKGIGGNTGARVAGDRVGGKSLETETTEDRYNE